jgi:hypothetical protein
MLSTLGQSFDAETRIDWLHDCHSKTEDPKAFVSSNGDRTARLLTAIWEQTRSSDGIDASRLAKFAELVDALVANGCQSRRRSNATSIHSKSDCSSLGHLGGWAFALCAADGFLEGQVSGLRLPRRRNLSGASLLGPLLGGVRARGQIGISFHLALMPFAPAPFNEATEFSGRTGLESTHQLYMRSATTMPLAARHTTATMIMP